MAGDPRDAAIRQWLPLIHRHAVAFSRLLAGYVDYDDLVSLGMSAVWRATESFDAALGANFSTHVYNHIKWTLLAEYKRARLPKRGLRAVRISIHPQDDDDLGIEITEPRPSPEHAVIAAELAQATSQAIGGLTPRQGSILRAHFYQGLTFQEIADDLGCSRQAVQQLEAAALRKLRATVNMRGSAEVANG